MRAINHKPSPHNFTSIHPKNLDHIHVGVLGTLVNNKMDLVDYRCLNSNQIQLKIYFEVIKNTINFQRQDFHNEVHHFSPPQQSYSLAPKMIVHAPIFGEIKAR
jgi:hypothetical protein